MQSYLNAVSVRKVYLWFPGSEMSNDVSTLVIIQGGIITQVPDMYDGGGPGKWILMFDLELPGLIFEPYNNFYLF